MKYFISKILKMANKTPFLWFLLVLLGLLGISVLNNYPIGYSQGYSDFFQVVNFKDALRSGCDAFVDYGEGNTNYFYVPFYYLLLVFTQGIFGQQNMPAVHCFIFLAGSFCSFYIAALIWGVDRRVYRNHILCFSLLYAINSYTAIRFALPSIYLLPYIFIPVLFATIHAYFVSPQLFSKKLLWCVAAMLISTTCWAGPPFFVAYALLAWCYIILCFIIFKKYSFLVWIKKCALYCFMFISSFLMQLLTWFVILARYKTDILESKYQVDNLAWMYSQSLEMLEVFSFRVKNLGLVNVDSTQFYLLALLAFVLFLAFIFSFLFSQSKEGWKKKAVMVFGFMVLLAIFFLNKGKGLPWEGPLHSLFADNLILCSLRSFDKILIFFPFLLLMPYCLYSLNSRFKYIPCVLLFFTFICTYPFLNGDIYKKYYAAEQGKDYMSSRYAALVKIPQEYFDITSGINRVKSDSKVLSLPWSLENDDLKGWLIAPSWKNSGTNPISQYLDHPLVQANAPNAFRGWNYGKDWNSQGTKDSFWLLPFAGFLNTKYLIYQKDVLKIFVSQAAAKIDFYRDNKFICLLASNSYFDFYEISDTYFLPHFYVPDRIRFVARADEIPLVLKNDVEPGRLAILEFGTNAAQEAFEAAKEPVIEYKKISPSRYKVKFHGIKQSFSFVFSEQFFSFWKVYPKSYSKNQVAAVKTYKIFEYNDSFQASRDELKDYIARGWISELGNGLVKKREQSLWISQNSEENYLEHYRFDFISKNIKGTIQNDNISGGKFYDTFFLKAIDEKFHRIANGYANYWYIDLDYLKTEFPQVLSANRGQTYDLEVIIEFWPQKLLNMSRVYTVIFATIVILLLFISFFRKGILTAQSNE